MWQDFPSSFFFLPKVVQEDIQLTPVSLPKIVQRLDFPDYAGWEKKVKRALENRSIDKIVLARRTTLYFDKKVDPFALLTLLRQRYTNGTLFLFQISPDAAFVGLSPEKLYRRKGREVFADAIAGTRPREKEDELFKSAKDRREFAFVKQFIHAELSSLCTAYTWEKEDRIFQAQKVSHLYNQFHGHLKENITDRDLLLSLHPTPAVAGTPRYDALRHLQENEPFERGWYAAPLGWVSKEETDLAIGIRSALVRGKEVHLFAGAGIVRGSDPKKEWEELNHKVIL